MYIFDLIMLHIDGNVDKKIQTSITYRRQENLVSAIHTDRQMNISNYKIKIGNQAEEQTNMNS